MNRAFQRTIALFLGLILVLSCVTAVAQTAAWQNSALLGSVTEKIEVRPQDDFYLATNRDLLASAVVAEGENTTNVFSERNQQVRSSVVALLEGKPQTTVSGQLAQELYSDFIDMDKQNALEMKSQVIGGLHQTWTQIISCPRCHNNAKCTNCKHFQGEIKCSR